MLKFQAEDRLPEVIMGTYVGSDDKTCRRNRNRKFINIVLMNIKPEKTNYIYLKLLFLLKCLCRQRIVIKLIII